MGLIKRSMESRVLDGNRALSFLDFDFDRAWRYPSRDHLSS